MYLNPTRNLENELILLGHLAETEFEATRAELKQRLSLLQSQYEQYAKDLTARLEFIKNEIEPLARATVFCREDMQLVLNALTAVNSMLFTIGRTGIHLQDSAFGNDALKKVGLKYTSVYGDTSEEAYAKLRGKYETFTDPKKILDKVHFAIKYSDYAPPYVADKYVRDCLRLYYDDGTNEYQTLAIDFDKSLQEQFEFHFEDDMSTIHPVDLYDPDNDNYFYYFKVNGEYRKADIRTVKEPYIPPEGFKFLTRTYGQLYQTNNYCTVTVHALRPSGIREDGRYAYKNVDVVFGYTATSERDYHVSVGTERTDSVDPETNEGYVEFPHLGRYIPLHSAAAYVYQRDDGHYVDITGEVYNDATLDAARNTYGTVYIRVPHFCGAYDVCVPQASQVIFNGLDFGNPAKDHIKCLVCGNEDVHRVWLDPDHTWLDVVCDNCGNHDASLMDIPAIMYTNRIHPYAFYDPDFSWIEFIVKETSLDHDLSLNRLWRGWWGTGIGCWSSDLESLLKADTLGNHGWDKATYQLTSELLFRILRWNLDWKVDVDMLFNLIIDTDQAKALFQIANLWAVRHELIRLLTAQIYKIYKKGVIYHA